MLFSALDVGTKQIRALVAELKKDGQLDLLSAARFASAGMKRGEPDDVESLAKAVGNALSSVRQIGKSALKNVFVNINGGNVRLQESRGIVAVSRADNEIYPEDVDRVIKASQAVNLGHNRLVLHTITKEFIIDGVGEIADPVGMIGNRLEVESVLVDAFKPNVNNIVKCVEALGGRVAGPIYSPLAGSRAMLSRNQKELGVLMIDIGFGTTGITAYEDGKLLKAKVIPVGGGHVTNDIAIGLKCPVEVAEAIKLSSGCAFSKEISSKERINLFEIDDSLRGEVSRKTVAEIIEARIAEIFELVNNELKEMGKAAKLPAGVVLAGAGAKMPGLTDLAKQEFKLSVQIGIPEIPNIDSMNAEVRTQIEDPEFAVASGLLLLGRDHFFKESNLGGKFSFGKIFKSLLP